MITKYYYVLVLFFLMSTDLKGQTSVENRRSRIDLMAMSQYSQITAQPSKYSFGIMGTYHFNDRLSSLFPLSFGSGYAHLSLSTAFAPIGLLILKTTDEFNGFGEFFGTLLAVATALERIGIHFQFRPGLELIPYYSLLGLHVYGDNGYGSASAGTMMRFHFAAHWFINGHAEFNYFYSAPHLTGLLSGISIGYAFK